MADLVGGAVGGASAGSAFGPVGAFAGAILGGILGGVAGSQKSPQEEAAEGILADLEGLDELFKTLPFTKEEVMQELLPQAQGIYRGAADIVAGKIGAQTGEAGIAKGQGAKDFYLQSIAPVIAQGEQLAGGAIGEYANFFAQMSENQKGQLLNFYKTKLAASQGLPDMTTFQRTITGAFSGMQVGSNIQGDIGQILDLGKETQTYQDIIDQQDDQTIQQASANATTGGGN